MLTYEVVAEDDALGEIIAKAILCKATDRLRQSGVSCLAGARAYAFAAVAMCKSAGAEVRELVANAQRQVREAEEEIDERRGRRFGRNSFRRAPGSRGGAQRPAPKQRVRSRLAKPQAVGE